MARLARSVYRSNNGHRRGNRAEPQFSRRGNPPPGAPARDRPSSPGQRPSAHQPRRITGWSAGLRPASRGSAKPAPTTPPPANLTPANPRIPNRAESRGHGAPVSDRHRAAARNPHQQPRPPPISRLQTHASPTAQNHADMERWPVLPVGASDRHRAAARNPHQQRRPPPISRLPTHHQPRRITGSAGAPVSDRHRAAARNPPQQRRPPPISRPTHQPRRITPTWSAGQFSRWGPPTGIARQRETRPNNAAPRQSHACKPTHRQPRRITPTWSAGQFSRWGPPTGIARQRETRPDNAGPVLSVASGPVLDVD